MEGGQEKIAEQFLKINSDKVKLDATSPLRRNRNYNGEAVSEYAGTCAPYSRNGGSTGTSMEINRKLPVKLFNNNYITSQIVEQIGEKPNKVNTL